MSTPPKGYVYYVSPDAATPEAIERIKRLRCGETIVAVPSK